MWSDPIFINQLIIPIAGMLTGIVLGLPVIKAVVRLIDKRHGGQIDVATRDMLSHVSERIEQLEDRLEVRVGELEERLDFTERLLAQAKDREGLPRGDA